MCPGLAYFDLNDLLAETLEALRLQAQAKGLKLVCHIGSVAPRELTGDPGHLRQVLKYLLAKVIQCSSAREISIAVERHLTARGDVDALRFEMSDPGIGIPGDRLALTLSCSATAGGRAISRGLVEQMGGNSTRTGQAGEGSVFTFVACLTIRVQPASESSNDRRPFLAAKGADAGLAGLAMQDTLPGAVEQHLKDRGISVPKGIEDLIPRYLTNRQADLVALSHALERNDYPAIRTMGHNMRGTGKSFGFPDIGAIGASLEDAAKKESGERIRAEISALTDYLNRLAVVPLIRPQDVRQ